MDSLTPPRRRSRKSHPRPVTPFDHWVLVGFGILVPLLPLMLGTTTTRPWPMFGGRMAIVLIFTIFIFGAFKARRRLWVPALWWVLLAGALFSLFQLLPLPPWLLALVSPEADRLYRIVLESLGLYGQGQWRPVSLDTYETWLGAAGYFSLLMVYLLAANLFVQREMMKRVLTIIALAGFGLAALGFIQKMFGATKIFGLIYFPPSPESSFFFSSFINPNNMAGFLGLSVPLQIAFAIKARERLRRALFMLMAVITSLAILFTLSRGGITAFAIGQMLFAFLLWRRFGKRSHIAKILVGIGAVVVIAHELAVKQLIEQFRSTIGGEQYVNLGLVRPDLWWDTWLLIKSFPLTGIGAEVFKIAFPMFKTMLFDNKAIYPENYLLQVLADLGLVAGGFVVVGVALSLALIFFKREPGRLEMAAFCSVVAVTLQNMVDFNLSTFAVAVPYMILLAILTGRFAERTKNRWFRRRALPGFLRAAFPVLAVLVVLAGEFGWLTRRVTVAQRHLHAAAYDRSLPDSEFERILRAELSRHPADSYLRILASERYLPGVRSDFPMKLFHLQKAQWLNPSDPLIDRFIGRAYARVKDRPNAVEAYRNALRKMLPRYSCLDIWKDMLKNGLSLDDLVAAIPEEEAQVLELGRFLKKGDAKRARRVLAAWMDGKGGKTPEVLFLLGRIHLDEQDEEAASSIAEELVAGFPQSHRGYQLMGRIAERFGRPEEAPEWYRKALERKDGLLELLLPLANVMIRLKRFRQAEEVIARIRAMSWKEAKAYAHLASGDLDGARGRYRDAAREYERALVYMPENGSILYKAGRSSERQKNYMRALKFYQKAWRADIKEEYVSTAIKRMEERISEMKNRARKP